jgi:hypothetical protein
VLAVGNSGGAGGCGRGDAGRRDDGRALGRLLQLQLQLADELLGAGELGLQLEGTT